MKPPSPWNLRTALLLGLLLAVIVHMAPIASGNIRPMEIVVDFLLLPTICVAAAYVRNAVVFRRR